VEDSVLTIRVIKSFPYRITKNLVLQHVNLKTMSVAELKELAKQGVSMTDARKTNARNQY
jgi:hypothetical protein